MKLTPIIAGAVMLGLASPALAQSTFLSANLLGDQVPGGAGDKDASADLNGEIDLKKNSFCYYLDMSGLDDASESHVHQAKEGDAGPAVLTLTLRKDGDEACVTGDHAVLAAIAAAPKDYYVDIHTPGHLDGAARGQLKD